MKLVLGCGFSSLWSRGAVVSDQAFVMTVHEMTGPGLFHVSSPRPQEGSCIPNSQLRPGVSKSNTGISKIKHDTTDLTES